jgi:thioredoxin 1
MHTRRPGLHAIAAGLALSASLVCASPSRAVEHVAFTPAALAAARTSGKPVLVDVSAPWCSVCKAQKPILSQLYSDPAYKDLVVFDVDFDSQKPALTALRVNAQSTLIVYHGDREVGRSTGDTDRSSIKALIDKAI